MTAGAEGPAPSPSEPEGLSPDGLRRVVAVSDRFEQLWREGRRPRIEEALEGTNGVERAALLMRLVALEVDIRRGVGEGIGEDDYRDRFPADSSLLRSLLSGSEPVEKVDRRAHFPTVAPDDEASEIAPADAGSEIDPGASGDSDPSLLALEDTATRTLNSYDELTDSHPIGPPPPMPERISRYQVIELLGEGGFGRVYLAWDDKLDRHVAVKVPRAGAFVSPKHARAFVSEARLAAKLKHPAIVTVHDIGNLEDETLFVVLEYVEGRSLSDLLRKQDVSHRRLAELLAEVAEALHYAHSRGLVHRDLKPANLLIDTQGRPHIADFGLAVHEEGVLSLGRQIAGTLHYMAPEQVLGESHRLDGRTDLWGLGVVLYQMLTGRLPFQGRDRAEVFRAILERTPAPPSKFDPSLPPERERICLKCLSKAMTDRYPTALELAAALWSCVSKECKGASSDASTTIAGPASENSHDSVSVSISVSILDRPRLALISGPPRSSCQALFEELATVWAGRPERSRYLPSLSEWVRFAIEIRRSDWTPDQTRMMRAGARHHAWRLLVGALVAGALAFLWKHSGRPADGSHDRWGIKTQEERILHFDDVSNR